MNLNASTSKSVFSVSMSPKFVTKILLKSTSKCLSNDMFIIFFGYVVVKNSNIEDCFLNMKWDQKQINFYENSIFHEFLVDLNASTSKIQISVNMLPNFVTKILLKSTSKCLSNDMLIIFFGYVVVKNSVVEDCFPNMKWHQK